MNAIETLFKVVGNVIVAIVRTLFDALGLVVNGAFKRDGIYNARFATTSSLLSSWNHGFCITGTGSLTRRDSYRHAIVFSPSGGGKSTVVVVPTILRMAKRPCSIIVHDPSGEIFALTSGHLKASGYDVRVLSFTKPEVSARYNPMARVGKPADLRKVAGMIVRHAMGGNRADPFWDQSAASLITVLMQVLETQPVQYRNLANVRHLLNTFGNSPEKLDALIARYAGESLFEEYAATQTYQEKMRSGIIASARAALDMWADEDIATLTSSDTIGLETLRERPTAIFVQSHTAQIDYYSLLVSLFFEQLLGVLMRDLPRSTDLDVFLLMDEASSLRVPVLPTAIANLRKYRSGLLLAYQDYSQLIHLYGRYEAEAIRQNAYVKVYFADQSLETSTDLEKLMGKYETKDEKGRHWVRPLMTSDEIRTLPKDRALILAGGLLPILGKLTPFYKQGHLRKLTTLPPIGHASGELPPLVKLPLDEPVVETTHEEKGTQ